MDNNFGREQLSISGRVKSERRGEDIYRPEEAEFMRWGVLSGPGQGGSMQSGEINGRMPMQSGRMNRGVPMQFGGMNEGVPVPFGGMGVDRPMGAYGMNENMPMWMPGRPFYMQPTEPWNEKGLLRDLDYLKQMYPEVVRRYMDVISDVVDKMDYEGGMIYDEYPDQYQLKRLSQSVVEIIRRKEIQEGRSMDGDALPWGAVMPGSGRPVSEEMTGTGNMEDKWIWIEYLVRVLLSLEIYRRRNHKSRYY